MPYRSKQALPDSVRHVLPAHAQEIYKEAFNSAWEQYKHQADRRDDASREETAHKVAWAAVKNDYQKGDDDKWHKKKNNRPAASSAAPRLASVSFIAYCR